LREKLWPDGTFVDFDHSLNTAINKIREVLGDAAGTPHFVETVHRRGYRFIAPVDGLNQKVPGEKTLQNVDSLESTGIEATFLKAQKEERRPAKRLARVILVAVVLALAVGSALWYYFHHTVSTSSSHPSFKVVRLTSFPGIEREPAISPDGKMVAFVWDGEKQDNFDIYVKLIDAGVPIRLTKDPGTEYSPVWSPDGRYIAFGRISEQRNAFYMVPSLGGPERQLGEGEEIRTRSRTLDWSPDGKELAIVDRGGTRRSIFLLSVESREKRRLTFPGDNCADSYPSFSPDGHALAFTRWDNKGSDIYLVPVTGGEPRRLTFTENGLKSVWTADGREIIFASLGGDVFRLWRMLVSGGRPETVNLVLNIGSNESPSFSVSRQGNRLVYSDEIFNTDIWRIKLPASQSPKIVQERHIFSSRNECTPQISPDGKKVAFTSDRSGKYEIWVCDSDGRNSQQLTFSPEGVGAGTPRWSPDGRYIAYDSGASASGPTAGIYVISAEGGSPRLVTDSGVVPSWSKDGRSIYFFSSKSGDRQIWRVPADGGKTVQITKAGGLGAFESDDGRRIYYSKWDAKTISMHIWEIPVGGGEETQVFDEPIRPRQWALAQNGIYFVPKNEIHRPLLKFFSFTGGQITPIARLEKDAVTGPYSGLAVSPDGHWLLCPLTEQDTGDIMLVENFR
jgi:Tol biopolymer transport system component